MANESRKFDENGVSTVQGVTNDVALETRNLRVDPSTNRLLVDAEITPAEGGSTAANQTTIIGHLDGVEASLSSIDTDTTTIIGHLDGVETSLTAIAASLDDIEAQLEEEWSIFRSLDLDETEEEIKATAGKVGGWYIFNAATSIRYLKFYNATAANVTVGTTTPVLTIPIPAAASGGVGANVLNAKGITFGTAITVAATTGLADNDTGAPGANEVIVNVFYK